MRLTNQGRKAETETELLNDGKVMLNLAHYVPDFSINHDRSKFRKFPYGQAGQNKTFI